MHDSVPGWQLRRVRREEKALRPARRQRRRCCYYVCLTSFWLCRPRSRYVFPHFGPTSAYRVLLCGKMKRRRVDRLTYCETCFFGFLLGAGRKFRVICAELGRYSSSILEVVEGGRLSHIAQIKEKRNVIIHSEAEHSRAKKNKITSC